MRRRRSDPGVSVLRYRAYLRWGVAIAAIGLMVLSAATVRWFVTPSEDSPDSADAVVMFSGGEDTERLDRALDLMNEGVAPTLVLNEGDGVWFPGPALAQLCRAPQVDFEVVCVTADPDTTRGEAAVFGELAAQRGWDEIVLVTSSWHLHRSELWLDRCTDATLRRVGADTPNGVGRVLHELAGTVHAVVFDRSCPGHEGVITGGSGGLSFAGDGSSVLDGEQAERDARTAEPSETAAPPERPTPSPPRPGYTECQDWLGRRFLASIYSAKVDHPRARTVAEAADIGYTHVGPWYEDDRWTAGAVAADLDLCTVFPVGPNRSIDDAVDDLAGLGELVRADVERALADAELNASISAWALLPEEPKTERTDHLDLLARMSTLIRSLDPLGRPIFTYLPSNADVEEITRAAEHLDVLGQGNYLSTDGEHDERVRLPASIRRTEQAGVDAGRDSVWLVPLVEHRIHRGRLDPSLVNRIDDWVRHDLHAVIATGADGFLAFSGFPPDEDPEVFERYRRAHATTMAELQDTGLLALHDGAPSAPVEVEIVDGPTEIEVVVDVPPPTNEAIRSYPSATARAWESGTDRVVLVVNHAEVPIVAVVTTDVGTTELVLEPLGIAVIGR